jgi:hypothetical protein
MKGGRHMSDVSMLRKWLESLPSIQDMKKEAKLLNLKVRKNMKKNEVRRLLEKYLSQREKEEIESRKVSSSVAEVSKKSGEKLENVLDRNSGLPSSYGKNKVILLPVNPNWVYAYWDFDEKNRELLENLSDKCIKNLRLHDVTFIKFNGKNSHRTFEIDIDLLKTRNYYFNVPMPNADYILECGYKNECGEFISLLSSNVCHTPSNAPAMGTRERWLDLRKDRRTVLPVGNSLLVPVEKIHGSSNGSEKLFDLSSGSIHFISSEPETNL